MVAVSPLTSTLGLSIPIVKYRRLPSAMSAKYSKRHRIRHIVGIMGPLALVKPRIAVISSSVSLWNVFDLCLMKRAYLNDVRDVDATSSATITADESAVLETYVKFEQEMIDKDMDTLNSLVTEDKTFTHMSGKTQTKE